jgi:hypothetical protein
MRPFDLVLDVAVFLVVLAVGIGAVMDNDYGLAVVAFAVAVNRVRIMELERHAD